MNAATAILVDDDPAGLQTTHAQLLPEGYAIELFTSGLALMPRLERAPADVIVLDMMMPELDGLQVTRKLKDHPEWRYVPVLVLTANDTQEALIDGLDAGADLFVAKPVDGPTLRARVRSLLRIRRAYSQLRDRKASVIERANLTAREREVLDLLLLGRTHEDIANVLGISERTSKFHQANLLAKLGAESRLDLMRLLL